MFLQGVSQNLQPEKQAVSQPNDALVTKTLDWVLTKSLTPILTLNQNNFHTETEHTDRAGMSINCETEILTDKLSIEVNNAMRTQQLI